MNALTLSALQRVGIAVTFPGMSEATLMLKGLRHGDPIAAEVLLPLVYQELRKLAAQKMACESPGHCDLKQQQHECTKRENPAWLSNTLSGWAIYLPNEN
jgi:hypothetical protein